MNIKFSYLYRDYGNYKNYGEIIFSNNNFLSIHYLYDYILDCVFDDRLFYPAEWQIPDLYFDDWNPELDCFVHEFDTVEETTESPTINNDIATFLDIIKKASNKWKI